MTTENSFYDEDTQEMEESESEFSHRGMISRISSIAKKLISESECKIESIFEERFSRLSNELNQTMYLFNVNHYHQI